MKMTTAELVQQMLANFRDELRNEIQLRTGELKQSLLELRQSLWPMMVAPALTRQDLIAGLRTFVSIEGTSVLVHWVVPFFYNLRFVFLDPPGEFWKLHPHRQVQKRLLLDVITVKSTDCFLYCGLQLWSEDLSQRFRHFHSTNGTDCPGTYQVPPIRVGADIWRIQEKLQQVWSAVNLMSHPCHQNLAPELCELEQFLCHGGEHLPLAPLRLPEVAERQETKVWVAQQ